MPNISNFAEFVTLHRPSKYTVEFIEAPAGVSINQQGGDLTAESITFPGRSIASIERRTFGPLREMPYERLYTGDIEIVFAHDVDVVRTAVEQWMDKIISPADVIESNYSLYTAEIKISIENEVIENRTPGKSLVATVKEAWPKTINPIQLGYGMVDDYVKMSVSFSFREVVYEST